MIEKIDYEILKKYIKELLDNTSSYLKNKTKYFIIDNDNEMKYGFPNGLYINFGSCFSNSKFLIFDKNHSMDYFDYYPNLITVDYSYYGNEVKWDSECFYKENYEYDKFNDEYEIIYSLEYDLLAKYIVDYILNDFLPYIMRGKLITKTKWKKIWNGEYLENSYDTYKHYIQMDCDGMVKNSYYKNDEEISKEIYDEISAKNDCYETESLY